MTKFFDSSWGTSIFIISLNFVTWTLNLTEIFYFRILINNNNSKWCKQNSKRKFDKDACQYVFLKRKNCNKQ